MHNASASPVDPGLLQLLQSSNNEKVAEAIEQLRVVGTSAYLPLLARMLMEHTSLEIKEQIQRMLGELKDKSVIPVMAELLKDEALQTIHSRLLTACWSNGLDYSPYLSLLVDFVIDGNGETAFEALTVVENLEVLPEPEVCQQEIVRINRAIQTSSPDKTYLLQALRGVLA